MTLLRYVINRTPEGGGLRLKPKTPTPSAV
jgi:hypothetical protein